MYQSQGVVIHQPNDRKRRAVHVFNDKWKIRQPMTGEWDVNKNYFFKYKP
jgi:hypothetical protein